MFRVFRFVFVSTIGLLAAVAFERAWARETGPDHVDPTVAVQPKAHLLAFQPCPENQNLQCARLKLPVDYDKPLGEIFSMSVIRAAATKPARRIGVLMLNPGYPGGSGVDHVLASARTSVFERMRERFDVVSFDPRGVARSRKVSCRTAPRALPEPTNDAALAEFFDEFGRDVAQACFDQNGPFVVSLSTNNVARDMDALRRALGERQISFLGPSYGSRIGAVYASLFPDRVRAMVLDGAVPPGHRDDLIEFASQTAIAEELALQRLDALCRRDPECPLHEAGVIAALASVTANLEARPIAMADGRLLTANVARSEIGKLLNFETEWPRIVQLLAAALDADFAPLLATAAAMCSAWSAADVPVIRDVSRRVEHPILIIGVDFDSASPLRWSRGLAQALGMEESLIRYQGNGHTAFPAANSVCIDLAVEAYLFDLALPVSGTRCPGQPIHF